MTVERTEMVGLTAGHLQLTMGGEPVEVRPLTMRESDDWLKQYATALAGTDTMDGDTSEEQMYSLVTQASKAALGLVVAYDIEGVLGGSDAIADRATRREVADALQMMVTVEDPLAPAAGRLAEAAFGLPAMLAAERLGSSEPMLRLVRSLSTLSERGASTTPATSTRAGRASNSSSTGRTRRTASAGSPTSAAS